MEQLRVCLKVLCNSQEWYPSPLVSLKVLSSCGHTPSVPDPRVMLGPWLAQVHTYPVGTWNRSESASKCFATHKNGTHLHWSAWKYLLVVVTPPMFRIRAWRWVPGWHRYTPTLWVHGTAQSQPQSCFATHKNGTHLHWSTWKLLISCGHTPSVPDPRVTLGPWLAQVHTYPVGTWNSSESASKCFATHKNGTHLHWSAWKYLLVVVTPPVFRIRAWRWVPGWRRYTPTLWVHGTAQSQPQSALQLTRMAPISTG